MKKTLIIASLVFLPMQALAEWTVTDSILQGAFVGITVADWSQTLHISRDHFNHMERNRVIGPFPDRNRVNLYFSSAIILHTAVSIALPQPYRAVWQIISIGVEYKTVQTNRQVRGGSIGIKLHF